MDPNLLGVQRRLTHAFIAENPVALTLTPRSRVKQPAGGWAWEDAEPRTPQTMTLIEPTSWPRPTVTADGVERSVDFTLLGDWDSVVAVDDWFLHGGATWEVVEVAYFNGWETRALVSRRAS